MKLPTDEFAEESCREAATHHSKYGDIDCLDRGEFVVLFNGFVFVVGSLEAEPSQIDVSRSSDGAADVVEVTRLQRGIRKKRSATDR